MTTTGPISAGDPAPCSAQRQISIKDININTLEGRLLISALARLTTTVDTSIEPDTCLRNILRVSNEIYKDSPPINKTAEAMKQICQQLIDDKGYFQSWVSNIAMAFKDAHDDDKSLHTNANVAAHNFLNLLIHEELKKFPTKCFIQHSDGKLEEKKGSSLNRMVEYEKGPFDSKCNSQPLAGYTSSELMGREVETACKQYLNETISNRNGCTEDHLPIAMRHGRCLKCGVSFPSIHGNDVKVIWMQDSNN